MEDKLLFQSFFLRNLQVISIRKLEGEAWLDLARIYLDLETWPDADICISKTKATNIFNSRGWHTKGLKGNFHALPILSDRNFSKFWF